MHFAPIQAKALPPFTAVLDGQFPVPGRLLGSRVQLLPLNVAQHGSGLFAAFSGQPQLFEYTTHTLAPTLPRYLEELQRRVTSSPAQAYFVILPADGGPPLGHAAYLRLEPVHRSAEVGDIVYSPSLQRTAGATEAMALMAAYVFNNLNYRRYEWKCNSLNQPSRRAAQRLGFTYEGTFRQHMLVRELNRNTDWFSMLDLEWPVIGSAFKHWLAPRNFGFNGTQVQSLEQIRASLIAASSRE